MLWTAQGTVVATHIALSYEQLAAELTRNFTEAEMADINRKTDLDTGTTGLGTDDWANEELWWRESFTNRPYVRADRGFDFYSPGYRYGFESATKYRGRQWKDIEPELERGWDKFRGSARSTWLDIKEAVKDAWDHVTGDEHERHRRTTGGTVRPDQRF